jgi:tetratricopeptide (TPR) repeat protein
MDSNHRELRARAHAALKSGNLPEALRLQCDLVNGTRQAEALEPNDLKFLGYLFFNVGDERQSMAAFDQYLALDPHDVQTLGNKAHLLIRARQPDAAIALLTRAIEIDPDNDKCVAMLGDAHTHLRQYDQARDFGLRALEMRSAARKSTNFDARAIPIPPFRANSPGHNVISISLWGNHERYLSAAILNVQLAPHIYPGWRCRFWVDGTVPERVLDELKQHGADLVVMQRANNYDGAFWRFLVADDPQVDRYLVRDADAVINVRERVAVDAWIASGRHFHMMRDWWTHCEPMLAGLWGGVGRALPPLAPRIEAFIARRPYMSRDMDQQFLRNEVWPYARESALVHDSIFQFGGAEDFPALGQRAPGLHVGQDHSVMARMLKERPPGRILERHEVGPARPAPLKRPGPGVQ